MYKPIEIMEGALARRLRTRPALQKRGVIIAVCPEGGVIIASQSEILGIWKWTGSTFDFSRTSDAPVEHVATTLLEATFFTSSLLLG